MKFIPIFKTLTHEIVSSKKFNSPKKAHEYAELVLLKSLTIVTYRLIFEEDLHK